MDGFPSAAVMERLLHALPASEPALWAAPLAAACREHGINTAQRVACFVANLIHESGGFRSLVENLNYGNDRLSAVFGPVRGIAAAAKGLGRPAGSKVPLTKEQQLKIADVVYGGLWGQKNLGNRPGTTDARDFIGRGLVQLTGRSNYERFAQAIGVPVETLPAMLETREGAANSAAAFWGSRACNACADCGDHAGARKLVNGGSLGLEEVEHLTDLALKALAQSV